MTDAPPYDPQFAEQVVDHGRLGLSRAEVACELGVSLATFAAWSADEPEFAEALERADTEARAWWDARPRRALSSNETFKAGAWRQAMIQRYGSGAPRKSHEPEPEAIADKPVVRLHYPDNGRG